ncbi:hypothetical protein BaRGS_00038121, partial [Batillaria attramentaria]
GSATRLADSVLSVAITLGVVFSELWVHNTGSQSVGRLVNSLIQSVNCVCLLAERIEGTEIGSWLDMHSTVQQGPGHRWSVEMVLGSMILSD